MGIEKGSSLSARFVQIEPRKTFRALQGLRGIAILAIVLSHYPFFRNHEGGNALDSLGGLGVELFILLSGCLFIYWHWEEPVLVHSWQEKVLHTVRKCKKYYWLHIGTFLCSLPFWGASMLRYPTLALGFSLPLNAVLLHAFFPWSQIYFSMNWVAWYLSLNIFLLFASSDVLSFLKKLSFRQTVYMMLIIVAFEWLLPFVVPSWAAVQGGVHWIVYICPFVRVLDFVLGGGALVLAERLYPQVTSCIRWWLYGISGVMIGAMLWQCVFLQESIEPEFFAVAAWTIPSILVLFALACEVRNGEKNPFFENRLLVFVGDISFELFMVHQLVKRYAMLIHRKLAVSVGETIPLAVAFAVSIWIAWWLHQHAELFLKKHIGSIAHDN